MDVVIFTKEKRERDLEVLKTQKLRFLCAIGKAEEITAAADEDYTARYCLDPDYNLYDITPNVYTNDVEIKNSSINPFNGLLLESDTTANNRVNSILKKFNFDLKHYLTCAEVIYHMCERRPGKQWEVWEQEYCGAITYVIMHAKLFGDQTQNMFQLRANKHFSSVSVNKIIPEKIQLLPLNEYMTEIIALIRFLKIGYDETTFRILNANVTYLALLILRLTNIDEIQFSESLRHINTQDNYVKLCPHHLGSKLPQISNHFCRNVNKHDLSEPVYLAIYAYITVNDVLTKTILRETCLNFLEWHNMELPGLFFKVADLYGMEEARLWDILSCEKASQALSRMADVYYTQYKRSEAGKPIVKLWFPYCGLMSDAFGCELSGSKNVYLCTILAYIVDFLSSETVIGLEMPPRKKLE